MKKIFKKIFSFLASQSDMILLQRKIEENKILVGQFFNEWNKTRFIDKLASTEFKVFSQYGDDGIISYLTGMLDIPEKKFVEFGVENYTESNTRFLLINENWSGLVIDGNEKNIEYTQA